MVYDSGLQRYKYIKIYCLIYRRKHEYTRQQYKERFLDIDNKKDRY